MNVEIDYIALKKCVISDYPYSVDWNDTILSPMFQDCYSNIIKEHSLINNPYYSDTQMINGGGYINLGFIDHYVILCYRYSKLIAETTRNNNLIADAIYYSMRVRGNIDLYYRANIGKCFTPVHALGAVIDSHAKYGSFFTIYNGVHIGPYSINGKNPDLWIHPSFGDHVTLLGNSKIFGKADIGNNVIVSANTIIINETIPDNCIVSGISPNLFYMPNK